MQAPCLQTGVPDPQLLEGLNVWLHLGLLSDAQVRQLCQDTLICLLPQPVVTNIPASQVTESSGALFPQESQDFVTEPVKNRSRQRAIPTLPRESNRILQSLMAELSVRWLLFLGVFMVVVSSGVLAASQWERFPASGQYGVLLAYTLIFWTVSFWANRQGHLSLTAQTLQIVTQLLVPVNFWAIDSFGLWQNPGDWIVAAIATVTLTTITILLLKNSALAASRQLGQQQWLPILNFLGLNYLHWGWKLPGFPLIAVYVGMVGTSLVTFYRTRFSPPSTPTSALNLAAPVTIYALVILLVRAIFVVGVDISQLGLALGICGWLVAWLAQQLPSPETSSPTVSLFPGEKIGGILILFGWLVSVGTTVPWQAVAVSGLGLWFLRSRLTRFWQKADLAALFGVGLQIVWLVWRLVPQALQEQAIAQCTQLIGHQGIPFVLLSLAFPYIILMVRVTEWLYAKAKPDLAAFGEWLALILGTVLTLLSLANPTLRSLTLLFSTLTLGFVTQRHPSRVSLVYLTHIVGLLTLGSVIDRLWSNLSREVWASILLAVMVVEWGFANFRLRQTDADLETPHAHPKSIKRSAWHIGLGLAGLSYAMLSVNASLLWVGDAVSHQNWGLLWLIAPLSLTVVAAQTAPPRRELASWLSAIAVSMAQLLTLMLPGTRIVGLGVAVGLMWLNTRYLRQLAAALITVGFGLSFITGILWDRLLGVPRLSASGWFLAGAIALLSVWLLRSWLIGCHGTLAAIYAQASDGWAIVLCSLELSLLTLHSVGVYQGFASSQREHLIAATLTLGAIAYRSWRQPANWVFYGLGWGLELLTAEALGFASHSLINLSLANIALGLITQMLGEVWQRRYRAATLPNSWHSLPLLYGIWGGLLQWGTFSSWTGVSSLGIALIAIGVGRRRQEFKPLVYLGISGVSISAYEILLYQIIHRPGGYSDNSLVAMSILGTTITYAYRLLSPWLSGYLRLTPKELKLVAHVHWACSSCLFMAAITSISEAVLWAAVGTGGFLSCYAIFQGRHNPNLIWAEVWVYLGILEGIALGIYFFQTHSGSPLLGVLFPYRVAIACGSAYLFYLLPWETWGWLAQPWQRTALVLPLVAIGRTVRVIHPINLLIPSGLYILISQLKQQIRFTYLSVALIDWALFRWFEDLHFTDPLWYFTPVGLSLLYIAQVDPSLKLPSQRETRHYLRLLGTGVICVVAFLLHQETGLQPWIASIIAIFAGLALRVRAFLYVGTATFLVTGFYQLVVFIFRHPFFKWVVGLLVGISFIWIAANFETRREQLTTLMRNWLTELQEWD